MAPPSPQPIPGNMTVPPTEGFGQIQSALALVAVVAVVALLLLAVGAAVSARGEWQAWLESRSAGRRHTAPPLRVSSVPERPSREVSRP